MEESTIKEVEDSVKSGFYRNKSHFIELATKKYLNEENNGRKKDL